MEDITDEVIVSAPAERVWRAIQDPVEHVKWHPFAARIDGEHSLGGVRECSVLVGKRPGTTAQSTFRPRPLVRVMMPVIRHKFHQTQRAILDGLRQHVEQ
jgi:hypothetical protein